MKTPLDLKAKILAYELKHPEECAQEWKCGLCGWEVKLAEPHCIGAFCCGKCGMSCLRPAREFEKDETKIEIDES